jgi:hypothetical protein
MRPRTDALFCLACGGEMAAVLRRAGSLRCHDCRDALAPLSLEFALKARELRLEEATRALDDVLAVRRPAA